MGFLSDLVEDVFDTAEKIIKAPARVVCEMDRHNWKAQLNGSFKCSTCGKVQKP